MKRFYNLLFTSICFLLFSCSLFIDQKLIDKSSILKPKEGYTIVTFNIGQNESSLNSPRGVFVPQKLENFTNIDYTINIETSSGFFVTSATGSIDSIKTSFALQKGNKYNVEILGNISQEGQIKTVVKDTSQIDLTNTQEYLTVILNPKFFTDQSQKGNLSIEFDGLDAQYTYNYKIIYSNGDITTKGLISLDNPKIQKNDISPGQHRLILTVNKTDVPSTIYFQKTFFVNVYSNVTTKNYFDESETLSEKVSLTEQMNENKPIFNENVVIYVAGQDATIASQEDSSIASILGGTSLLRFNNLYQALQFVQSVGIADNVESPYPIYLDGTVQFNNAIGDATKYTSTNKLNILLSSVNEDSVATIKTESRKQTTLEIKEFASVTLNNISLEGSNTPDSREHSILVNGTLIIKGKFYAEKLIYLPNDASTALIKLADNVSKLDSKENCGIIKRDSYPATGEGAQQVLQKLDSTQTSFATNLFSLESETHTINEEGQIPPPLMYSDWSSLCAAVSALDESLTTVTQFIINDFMIVSQTLQNKVPIKIVSNGPCELMRSDTFTGSFFKPEAALSIGGNNKITLDGNNVEANGSIIDVTTDISLEVTNCDFKWAKSIYDGGAISVTSNKTNPAIIKIQNSDFIRNHSTANNANGGALYFTYNCTATLDNCNIKNNDCKSNGGAIAIESNSCDVTINNCVIQSNCINNDNGQGGGIYLYKGKLRLFNTDVSQNNKSKSGNNINYAQDIYFYNMGNPTLTLNGENNVTNIEYEIASSATSLNTIKLENDTILTNYMTFRIKFTSTSGISLTEAAIVEWKDTSKTFTETDFNNFILDSTVKDYELVLSDDKKSINIKKKDGS